MTEKPQGTPAPTPDDIFAAYGDRYSQEQIDAHLRLLVYLGLLVEVEPGIYRITPAGRAAAQTAMYGAPLS